MSNVYVIEVPENATEDQWEALNEFMAAAQDAFWVEAEKLAKELDVPIELSSDFLYLRTRSRHSYETEKRMIRCYRETGRLDFRTTAGEEEDVLSETGY